MAKPHAHDTTDTLSSPATASRPHQKLSDWWGHQRQARAHPATPDEDVAAKLDRSQHGWKFGLTLAPRWRWNLVVLCLGGMGVLLAGKIATLLTVLSQLISR